MRHHRTYPLASALLALVMAIAAVAGVTIEIGTDGTVRIHVDGDSQVIIEQTDDGSENPGTEPGGWPTSTKLVRDGGIGFDSINLTDPDATVSIEGFLIRGGELGFRVQQGRNFPAIAGLTVRDTLVEASVEQGGYVKDVRSIDIDGLIVRGVSDGRFDNFLQGVYISVDRAGLAAEVTVRHSAFIDLPHYGLKFRSDRERGFKRIVIEDCLFVDCPEPLGFKPNEDPTTGQLPRAPNGEVVIRNCVFVWTGKRAWPDDWPAEARKLVRLYRAEKLVFEGNVSMGTIERADQAKDAIAYARWPSNARVAGNRHRDTAPALELPASPKDIKPLIERLRQ